MVTASASTPLSATQSAPRGAPELEVLVGQLSREIADLRRQLAWFQRQIFGQKSERRLLNPIPEGRQASLGECFDALPAQPQPKKTRVQGHERQPQPNAPTADEPTLFFDEKVPVQIIHVPNPEAEGLSADAYEVIGQKVSHRLAQRPGSYVVLKYVRPVIKRHDTQMLSCMCSRRLGWIRRLARYCSLAHGWLRRLPAVCEEDGVNARAVLGALPT